MTICVGSLTIVLYLGEAVEVNNDERGKDKNARRRDWAMNCRLHPHELKAFPLMGSEAAEGFIPSELLRNPPPLATRGGLRGSIPSQSPAVTAVSLRLGNKAGLTVLSPQSIRFAGSPSDLCLRSGKALPTPCAVLTALGCHSTPRRRVATPRESHGTRRESHGRWAKNKKIGRVSRSIFWYGRYL